MKLDDQEQKIEVFRKHWLAMFFELILFAVIAVIPVVFVFVLLSSSNIALIDGMKKIIMMFTSLWIAFAWIAFFIVYTDYFLDIWVLTDKRLIDAEQLGLFAREVSVVRIEHIQDATTNVTGILPTIFGYGDVHIQTAASEKEFVLRNVNNPKHVRDMIMRQQELKMNEVKKVQVV